MTSLSLPRPAAFIAVGVVFLLCLGTGAAAETETETQPTTSYLGSEHIQFSMVAAPTGSANYPKGNGSADVQSQWAGLAVHLQAEGMKSTAHFMFVLTANGVRSWVANMTTGYDGEVEAEATVTLPQGSYAVGLEVLDTSSFSSPTVVLVSSPETLPITIASSTQAITTQTSQSVSTFQGGETDDESIHVALQTGVIPAIVDLGGTGSSVQVSNGNFSVAVGRFQANGFAVSISASNVNGPRVLLVNLTSTLSRAIFSGPFQITLDGTQVEQATSLSQVLGAAPGDPARFILVSVQSSLRLLISIPHFSYHVIDIFPVAAVLGSILMTDSLVLVVAVAAFTAAIGVVYIRRNRVSI